MSEVTIWLAILVVCVGIEIATMGLTTIWFAGGALVSAILAALNVPLWLQIVAFFGVSLILLYLTRPVAVKYFKKDRVKPHVASRTGRPGVAIREIENLAGIGQVTVGGQEWSARSVKDDVQLPVGSVVVVRSVSGVKLIVEEKNLSADKEQ